jgi:hypothetical protein
MLAKHYMVLKNYAIAEEEFVGFIFVSHKFRCYIDNSKVIVNIDHYSAITNLKKCKVKVNWIGSFIVIN